MAYKLKVLSPLLICFLLNLIIHGNLLIGVLNALLLGLCLFFFQNFASKSISSIELPYLLILGVIPLFNHNYDLVVTLLAIGLILLLLAYLRTNFKLMLIPVILLYMIASSAYANEIIRLPFVFKTDRLIFNDRWTNQALAETEKEALYLPHRLRSLVFNKSVYLYVLLSKIAELFMLKNLYEILLIANLYPLFSGLIANLKLWNKEKLGIFLSIFLIILIAVSSNGTNTFNTFILLSPFTIYFILRGFASINKKIYFLLVILSFLIVTSPTK